MAVMLANNTDESTNIADGAFEAMNKWLEASRGGEQAIIVLASSILRSKARPSVQAPPSFRGLGTLW